MSAKFRVIGNAIYSGEAIRACKRAGAKGRPRAILHFDSIEASKAIKGFRIAFAGDSVYILSPLGLREVKDVQLYGNHNSVFKSQLEAYNSGVKVEG